MKFGTYVRTRRKQLGIELKELASQIKKPTGKSIAMQHMHDIEFNRRAAQPYMIDQIARLLKVPADYLFFLIGQWPPKVRRKSLSEEEFSMRFSAFTRAHPKTSVMWNLGKKRHA